MFVCFSVQIANKQDVSQEEIQVRTGLKTHSQVRTGLKTRLRNTGLTDEQVVKSLNQSISCQRSS